MKKKINSDELYSYLCEMLDYDLLFISDDNDVLRILDVEFEDINYTDKFWDRCRSILTDPDMADNWNFRRSIGVEYKKYMSKIYKETRERLIAENDAIDKGKSTSITSEFNKNNSYVNRKIRWNKTERLLIYFYNQLLKRGFVEQQDDWADLLVGNFEKVTGESYNNKSILTQNEQMLNKASAPKGAKDADRLLDDLEKLESSGS